MALITPQDVKENTSMGGNVDADKYIHLLNDAEVLILEPELGTALYDKIVSDFNGGTLAGDYLEIYENYIRPVLWHSVYAMYLKDGIVLTQNTGIYQNVPDNGTAADIATVNFKYKAAQAKADVYLQRLQLYLCDKSIPEYQNSQPNDYDVDPREVNTLGGWYLPDSYPQKIVYGKGEYDPYN